MAPQFLVSALDGDQGSASRPEGRALDTHCIEGWVGPRTVLDAVE
jgi:hypothetical protein